MNIKLSIYSIFMCCLNYIFDVVLLLFCSTNCYGALLELHVYFILTKHDVIHTIIMSDLHFPRNIS